MTRETLQQHDSAQLAEWFAKRGDFVGTKCMTRETLQKFGYRQIKSEAQAWQLLRRELKRRAKWQQRDQSIQRNYTSLLAIKPGNWFKLLTNPKNPYYGILVWEDKWLK